MGWLAKFLSGFAIFNGERIGKILWVLILFAGFTLAGKYLGPKAHPETQIQNVDTYVEAPKNTKIGFVGVKLWRVGIGIYYE